MVTAKTFPSKKAAKDYCMDMTSVGETVIAYIGRKIYHLKLRLSEGPAKAHGHEFVVDMKFVQ